MSEQIRCKSCKKSFSPIGKFTSGMCQPCEIDDLISRNLRHIIEVQEFMHANLGQEVWMEAKLWAEKKKITLPESLPPEASVLHPRRKPWNEKLVFVFQEPWKTYKDKEIEPLWTHWPGRISISYPQWDSERSRHMRLFEIILRDRSFMSSRRTHWPDLRDCRSQAIMHTWSNIFWF